MPLNQQQAAASFHATSRHPKMPIGKINIFHGFVENIIGLHALNNYQ